MTNIELLKDRIAFHIRDVTVKDINLNGVISDVINDIALETKVFKKIIGFTIEKAGGKSSLGV